MLSFSKYSKNLKVAVYLFIATTAIFLLANFTLAAEPNLGLNYVEATGLSNTDPRVIIANIIRIALGFLGIIAVSLIIYAGFIWMTSNGNEEKIEQAKNILKNAVIGLIIIFASFAIATFILNMLTNSTSGGANNPAGGGPSGGGISALGNGIIESHYPARGQKDVPRNTSIIVTFREAMQLDTLCDPVGTDNSTTPPTPKCNGGAIANNNVRIFKLADELKCLGTAIGTCPTVSAKVYSTTNNKTFVFMPDTYLGSPAEYINYAVYLGNDILKADGKKAFGSFGNDYEWSFEVSNKIDLTPPQVESSGIFPAPDVSQDAANTSGQAVPARWTITVSEQPLAGRDARVASTVKSDPQSDTPAASTIINANCQQDGTLNVSLADNGGLVAILYSSPSPGATMLGQGVFGQNSAGQKTIAFGECNLLLTLNSATGSFTAGNGWNITVSRAITADTLTVGNTVYTFVAGAAGAGQISLGSGIGATAANIKIALSGNNEVTATSLAKIVTITAAVAGTDGNNIELKTSNPDALTIAAAARGADKQTAKIVKGRGDKPMNATIQLDFNEAVMPLTVSGANTEVENYIRVVNNAAAAKAGDAACSADAECKSYKCVSNKCAGNSLGGKFEISNQYRTVNFISDNECGFNACGEKIYCLPANSRLKVELAAANFAACAANLDCASKAPFNLCDSAEKICQDANGKNYPQADMTKPNIVDGIVDMAMNSLDGNRDILAQGPVSYYNENDLYGLCANGNNRQCSLNDEETVCGSGVNCTGAVALTAAQNNGDSFRWSFFISDLLDITSPKATQTVPAYPADNVGLSNSVQMHFDKLMMSSRLTTGSVTVVNGEEQIVHQLLNLNALAQAPLAYWVTGKGFDKEPKDGEYEESDVFINHSNFSGAASYQAQAGSGLKDVYQNCYKPGAGPACSGAQAVSDNKPSCCNGRAKGVCE
ncbi:MAG: hypothetical protein PHS62_00355 [Patescibacteria group bacterium]|nr:hypothetical protein [Patescibacteria group bacterium]